MNNLEMYCVTNKRLKYLENFSYNLAAVGKEKLPKNYIKCNTGENIFSKEKYYSELTFHYWFWKNKFNIKNKNWIGFCQKRRFWLQENKFEKLNKNILYKKILKEINTEWKDFDAIICKPIKVNNVKKIKMIKRGIKSLVKDPTIFFNTNKQTIKLHFDMHHGYGNLDKAIDVMNLKDREDFRKFVNKNVSFNPHIMFISKSITLDKWFSDLFSWLFECEKVFGFEFLKGYKTTRLYAYLAERYLSFWFNKYTKNLKWAWGFFDSETID